MSDPNAQCLPGLHGKVAVVTGGGQGLGEATVRFLAGAGVRVAINYFKDAEGRNQAQAEKLAGEIGADALAVEGDVRSGESVSGMVENVVGHFGGIDFLINNAGILRDRSFKKMSGEEWQQVIDTNLTGVFHVCKAAEPALREGGRIVNLASIAAFVGFFGQANYAAAKAGVTGLTRVLSRELGRRSITVNAVAPGVVLTEMGLSIPEEVRAEMLKNIPLGRFGQPGDIAGVVGFLCSDLAAYMTGQTLHVNGGWWG